MQTIGNANKKQADKKLMCDLPPSDIARPSIVKKYKGRDKPLAMSAKITINIFVHIFFVFFDF